ncbi:MAG TPA: hypothetical protein PK082_02185 [Phycisphaerae bacterium]|nr:hypothetical protein [Phycisphaerae bacterium]
MRATRRIFLVCGLALSAALFGCDKKVKLTFVNHTSQSLEVQLSGPGRPGTFVGMVGPTGGKLRHELKIKKDSLPATYQWSAGDLDGRFTITKETDKQMWLDIKSGGGLRDKHTEVQEEKKIEVKELPVEQYEVVE